MNNALIAYNYTKCNEPVKEESGVVVAGTSGGVVVSTSVMVIVVEISVVMVLVVISIVAVVIVVIVATVELESKDVVGNGCSFMVGVIVDTLVAVDVYIIL